MGGNTTANVLATIGTVCWCVQLIPQIIHNYRHKSTAGLPASMMLIWAVSALPFGVYFLLLDESVPLEVQPQLFGSLSLITWCQVLFYTHKFSMRLVVSWGIFVGLILGGSEALLVLTIRPPQNNDGIHWPRTMFGIFATVLFAVGFVPTYWELWRAQGRVIGIDFIFLSIDMSGALFSLISLAVDGSFDVLGGILYIIILVCELAIIASHCIWCLCHWDVVKEARRRKVTIDEIMEERDQAAREAESTMTVAPAEQQKPPDNGSQQEQEKIQEAPQETQPETPQSIMQQDTTQEKTQGTTTTSEIQTEANGTGDDDTIREKEAEGTGTVRGNVEERDLEKGIKHE